MFQARVRVTRRQEFPRGSIVIAGALSRLKTSLQEQREGALLQLSPCPLSAAPCSTLLPLFPFFIPSLFASLSLSFSLPLSLPFSPETLLHRVPPPSSPSRPHLAPPRAASPSSSPFRSKNLIFPRPTYAIRRCRRKTSSLVFV